MSTIKKQIVDLTADTLTLLSDVTAIDINTGSFVTDGGMGIARDVFIGGNLNVAGTVTGSFSGNAIQLQGRDISAAAPASGEVLTWNAGTSEWEPAATGAVTFNWITFSLSPSTNITSILTNRDTRYITVGDKVTVTFDIRIRIAAVPSGTTTCELTGLPVAASSTSGSIFANGCKFVRVSDGAFPGVMTAEVAHDAPTTLVLTGLWESGADWDVTGQIEYSSA